MKPYYDHGGITIYHGDAQEIFPRLTGVGAVVTDPPYGIGWAPRVNHRGKDQVWRDDESFDPAPYLALGKYHLFWGAQYFAPRLPVSESWLTWVKRPTHCDFSNDARSYATTELAWCDFGCKSAFVVHVWDGGLRAGAKRNREFSHPSQKPLEVMSWCLMRLPADCEGVIVDPFMGSGTTLRAAKDLGRRAIGIEIEERYCGLAVRGLAQEGLFPMTAVDHLAQKSYDRIAGGLVDEWGRERPDGPRKQLTPAQQRAYDLVRGCEGSPPGADNAGTLGPMR